MATFWVIASAMIVLALVLVLPPLLGRWRPGGGLSREQLNVVTYRDRARELEEALAAGTLAETEYAQARSELERAVLDDVGPARAGAAAPVRGSARPVAAVVVAVGIPLLAFGLYLQLGATEAFDGTQQVRSAPRQPSVEQVVAELEERLRRDPADAEAWVMLARAHAYLGRDEQAREAFAKAVALAPANAIALTGYAETLTRLAKGRIGPEAIALLERALAVEPDLQPALWLAGMAAFQAGDRAVALERWQRVRTIGGLSPEAVKVLDTFIAGAAGAPSARPASAGQARAVGAGSVRVRVALDPSIAASAAPGDAVYVFARAAKGPPMPLAVVRKTVADLPLTVTLDDSMAMVEGMRLSAFPEVVVGARISRAGTPTPAPGDLQGLSAPIQVAEAEVVEVQIREVVREGTRRHRVTNR